MKHGGSLGLNRCPHCNVAKPNMAAQVHFVTENDRGDARRDWRAYACQTCGGAVLAVTIAPNHGVEYDILNVWPSERRVDESIPERARSFLEQSIASVHAPAGAVMLAASAVDAMLKDKGFKAGNLYKRIDEAKDQHLITPEMAEWAHEVRLEANDQRHADEEAPLPSDADAGRVIEFAVALAQFLFVLPARVDRGRKK
ncbi:DUF4145 domain-containing protein [Pseudomonas moraviensis]|uniref:DUF4145 domain-containing protein n=1 Tax=Pseudomonas moraviensis TaxID=321662 RepID=UPI002B2E6679|nr:DUF4145 domain-containing protein [Pseudomonas moraviensis]